LLRVRGEIEYAVTPLADLDAVDLFCTRARAAPDDTIHRLCQALDNLPLAIELAAARASVLTPAQILERLSQRLDLLKGGRDADPRQQTLRATIEWSFDLLNPDERGLFARLAVFAGGSTLEAAEQIAKAALDTLQSLVDKSLVRRTGDRFWMLETIREFAAERLQASGEASTVRQRHLAYFTELAEHWYARRYTLESTWVPILEAETDNIRAALDVAQGSAADEIRLAGAIAEFWRTHGRGPEARARVEAAIGRHAALDPLRARGLMYLGGFDDDLSSLREALELWRANGDTVGEADTLETMGWVHDALGQYDAAHDTHQQSLAARSRTLEPEAHGLGSRAGLCHIFVAQGNTSRAAAEARELLAIARRNQAVYMQELALHFLADCPLVDGRYEESERAYRTALRYADEAGLIGRATDEVLGVAMSLAGQGQAAAALRIAASAHVQQLEIAMSSDRWWQSMQDRLLGNARRDLGAADAEQVEQEGAETPFDHIVERLLAPAEANADVAP
jgi:tetratricopeptide (TPR) repeat protein